MDVPLQAGRFDSTIGALLIGFAASAIGYGIFSIQVYTYYRRYPLDKGVYKALVALLWILETVDQAFIGHSTYYYTVTNYTNPNALVYYKPIWSLISQMTAGALVGTIVKACFSIRVWRFSYRNWILTGFLLFLAVAQMGLAVTFTIQSFHLPSLTDLINLRIIGSLSLGLGVVNDMFMAAALCYYLQGMRSSSSSADSLINSLTLYAINTGVLTSACSLTTLILYNFMPKNFVFMCFYFVLSKLYAISFLATLNTRQIIRGRGTDREQGKSVSFHMVTDPSHRSVQIPMPSKSYPDENIQKSQIRTQDSSYSSTPHYTAGW
ncbi:hypothetical protein BJ138DRAFT_1141853 [Hygrophoropsis aurantiaca]|uniref:Uncharacterized protein n=1 Tax=Hygrophoropsis aurantiaca TaxID=72124 RepID=A0ACB8APR9_9AGAM|nr:hypothetical protein BJ138DRAFT_1141853 [Hygrophoropsis aurantiaca]